MAKVISPTFFLLQGRGGGGRGGEQRRQFPRLRLNHLANQNVKFTSSLPLAKPAIKYIYFLNPF